GRGAALAASQREKGRQRKNRRKKERSRKPKRVCGRVALAKGIHAQSLQRISSRLRGFFDFARANARGAHFHALARARDKGADRLQVRVPAAAPGIVGVADYVAVARSLAAVLTLHCHDSSY